MRSILLFAFMVFISASAATAGLIDYPLEAAAKGEHGSIQLGLSIGEDGHVEDCRILRASGSASLDGAICNTMKRGSFSPSANRRLGKVTVHFILPDQSMTPADLPIGPKDLVVLFDPARAAAQAKNGVTGPGKARPAKLRPTLRAPTYPRTSADARHEGTTFVAVTASSSGVPTTCNVVRTSGFDDLDKATCQYVLSNLRYEAGTDFFGKKIADSDIFHLSWNLDK